MTEPQQPFCPIYREARSALNAVEGETSHLGLRFDKFAAGWRWNGNNTPPLRFDPPGTPDDWLNDFAHRGANPTPCGHSDRLTEACHRQRELVATLGGRIAIVTNTSRFVTGTGRQHPSENGFHWHPTLGTPFLPGSSLKGVVRSWCRDSGPDSEYDPSPRFGTPGRVGEWIFFDVLPVEPPRLVVEVMTPHASPYYQQAKLPGDWHSPVPIRYLAVESGTTWQVAIAPRGRRDASRPALSPDESDATLSMLLEAIDFAGVGAKTSVGFGRFRRDPDAERRAVDRFAKILQSERQRAEALAADAAFDRELADNSEPLRQLKRRRKVEQWQPTAGDHNLISALEEFADSHPNPPDDAIAWIRELLESMPKYRGVWDNPDATRGKANKPKPKYPSAKIRDLARRLNPKFRK